MIDISFIREKKAEVVENLHKRGRQDLVDRLEKIEQVDSELRSIDEQINELRQVRNTKSKSKPSAEEIKSLQELRGNIQALEAQREPLEQKRKEELASLPNILQDHVPVGVSDADNIVLETHGEPPSFPFSPMAHFEIPAVRPHIDTERGAKVSGTRFYYLRGPVAQLERALMNYAIDWMTARGFTFVLPPILVQEQALFGTGYFPNSRNEVYAVNPGEDNLFLIGTSEQPVMAMHTDEIISAEKLPLKYVSFSPCFRREAGSYGRDTQGILRVHQFYKTEMVVLCNASDASRLHKEMIECSKQFHISLGLPIRLLQLCSADTGMQSANTVDLEVWFPSQNVYREAGSASNVTDYQTRRLGIRTKQTENTQLLYSLNNTVTADRTLLAILENNQQEDGSVVIPEVLRPYCSFDAITI